MSLQSPLRPLPGEKQADYEGVVAGDRQSRTAEEWIEEFLVRDVVDLTREILRLRRIKAAIPEGLHALRDPGGPLAWAIPIRETKRARK